MLYIIIKKMPRRKQRGCTLKFKHAHTKMQKGIVNKEAIEKLQFEHEEKKCGRDSNRIE